MSNAIGLRFYKVTIHEERSNATLDINDGRLFHGQSHLLSEFITKHKGVTNVADAQRGWFFDGSSPTTGESLSGRITYGIHGIESRFVDITDRKEKFRRKSSDLEEIPLYFRFYKPSSEHYMIFAFQSYGVRSCVYLIQKAFRDYIKDRSGLVVKFRKLLPAEAGIDPFSSGIVKEMTLIKRKVSSDRVDSYRDDAPGQYDVKISLLARGKNNFGLYKSLTSKKIKEAGHSVALVDDFDKAVVKVSLGGNSKHITVFGEQGEAGTIDVTDDESLVFIDGHPSIESMDVISKPLIKHFNNALTGFRS